MGESSIFFSLLGAPRTRLRHTATLKCKQRSGLDCQTLCSVFTDVKIHIRSHRLKIVIIACSLKSYNAI